MKTKRIRKRQQVRKGPNGGMLLLLTEDVTHLGKQGDLVEVRPGYGRNYLVPQGMATMPSDHNLRLLDLYKERTLQAREARMADLTALSEQIQRVPHITIEAKANAEGHLYGSVGALEISRALKGKNLKVEVDQVNLEGPIKECALFEVSLNLGFDIQTSVQVMVVPVTDES